ncbi:hypothetical protein AB0E10_15320 [Streptomyces sp. NPDC048045]|uniref:hypothetical protein n=1 Tax=Streptomyces sp. NPDC048045 TaxID=3154710 RepID=UPI00344018FF
MPTTTSASASATVSLTATVSVTVAAAQTAGCALDRAGYPGAEAATLTFMAGGRETEFAEARPLPETKGRGRPHRTGHRES